MSRKLIARGGASGGEVGADVAVEDLGERLLLAFSPDVPVPHKLAPVGIELCSHRLETLHYAILKMLQVFVSLKVRLKQSI